MRLPIDYREYVELYGGGEIDDYLSISTLPVLGSVYGDLLHGFVPALPDDVADLAEHYSGGGAPGAVTSCSGCG